MLLGSFSELFCRWFPALHTQIPGDGGDQPHGNGTPTRSFSQKAAFCSVQTVILSSNNNTKCFPWGPRQAYGCSSRLIPGRNGSTDACPPLQPNCAQQKAANFWSHTSAKSFSPRFGVQLCYINICKRDGKSGLFAFI